MIWATVAWLFEMQKATREKVRKIKTNVSIFSDSYISEYFVYSSIDNIWEAIRLILESLTENPATSKITSTRINHPTENSSNYQDQEAADVGKIYFLEKNVMFKHSLFSCKQHLGELSKTT